MKRSFFETVTISLVTIFAVVSVSCNHKASPPPASMPRAASAMSGAFLKAGTENTMIAVRFLERRVKSDPDDLVALNKLANCYLQLYRETSDVAYLSLSLHSAKSSLQVAGFDQNLTGLLCLAQAQYATHDFTSARDNAREIIAYSPGNAAAYAVLGDALLELGEYVDAAGAYAKLETLDPDSVLTETRLAHVAFLRGDTALAERRYAVALTQAKAAQVPSAESVAWCHWQLGETTFQAGDYHAAERHYRAALEAYPNYVRALASLGRVRAALSDTNDAVRQYEQAMKIVPDPTFAAALGDLYEISGRHQDATRQYQLVEQIGKLNEFNGALYNRQLAVFYADHDLLPDDAYNNAAKEYAVRRDVYGADALAWSALKSGKTAEAQAASKEALRLGTRDARLFYHAGLIAKAAGDRAAAHEYLRQALTLNPKFDPLQAEIAKRELEGTRPAN